MTLLDDIQQSISDFQSKLGVQQVIADRELKSLMDFIGPGLRFDVGKSRRDRANKPIEDAREFVSGAPDILEALNIQLEQAQMALIPAATPAVSSTSVISPTVIFAGLAILGALLLRK